MARSRAQVGPWDNASLSQFNLSFDAANHGNRLMTDTDPQHDGSMEQAERPDRATTRRRMRLLDLLLSTDRLQRIRITHTLMAAFIFGICIALIAYAVNLGMIERSSGTLLSLAMAVTSLGYYIVLRSGLNQRFHDPALALPQIVTALTWVCIAYAITGEFHGGTLILCALVMAFGVFNMSHLSASISSIYAIVAMGLTMFYKSSTDPLHYPRRVEWIYFIFVLFIIPTIAQLSAQMASMRLRLRNQKTELQRQKIELERAMDRIRELATRDELTGLINRREMTATISQHTQLQKRKAIGFSVAMIDLDYFKRINDTWGHQVGDEVLRAFAEQARLQLRQTDIVGRWGGEEFLALLPETGGGPPSLAIDRLREQLSTRQVSALAPELRVTFSAGITTYRADEPIEEAIARADQALYQAKQAGRNQTVTA